MTKSDEVIASPGKAVMIGEYPYPYWWVVVKKAGKVEKSGYFPSDLLKLKDPPLPSPELAVAEKRTTALEEKLDKVSSTPPATTAAQARLAVLSPPPSFLNEAKLKVTSDWQDTGLVLKPKDLAVWGRVTSVMDDLLPFETQEEIQELEIWSASPGLPFPFRESYPSPGINNQVENGWLGMCHVTTPNLNNWHLYVRTKPDVESSWIKIIVRRGAYHG